MQQVYFTGLEALPFLGMLALLIGSTVLVQTLPQLQGVGAGGLIGKILVISIVTAMVVITRSGTAMAAEMSTNRVTGQVEALEAMGVDVFHYLIAPRVLGSMLAVFCMIIYFDGIALVGGFLVASQRLTMPLSAYLEQILGSLQPLDLTIGLSKGLLFGLVISLFSCYHGLRAPRALRGADGGAFRGHPGDVLRVRLLRRHLRGVLLVLMAAVIDLRAVHPEVDG